MHACWVSHMEHIFFSYHNLSVVHQKGPLSKSSCMHSRGYRAVIGLKLVCSREPFGFQVDGPTHAAPKPFRCRKANMRIVTVG